VRDPDAPELTLFALNRDLTQPLELEVDLRSFGPLEVENWSVLHDDDLQAVNTRDDPERVQPETRQGANLHNGRLRANLPEASWNVIRLEANNGECKGLGRIGG
jgi:alpha-N-arabinofuranosidase